MTLKRKIFLRVGGLLTAVIVIVTGLTCAFAIRYHRASTKDVFGAQLAVLSDRAEGLALWDDRVALRDLLRGTVRDHSVVEYAFIERLGRPYVHTFARGVPRALLGLETGPPDRAMVRELESEEGKRFFDLAMAVGDEQVVLHLGLSCEAIDRQALGEVLSIGLLGAAAIGLGIVLAGLVTRLITREVDQASSALRAQISERERAEEELARYRDHLEELVRQRTRELEDSQERLRQAERLGSIGTFAAGLAHEINNPLASILVTARHARKFGHDRGVVDPSLREIIEDTERCARIVKGVLQFARQERSEKQTVNLNDIVRRARNLTRGHAQQRRVHLELELSESLPSVAADPTGLEQVLVNVITNAVEASSEGRPVVLQTQQVSGRVQVRVQDRGRGMTSEERQHAFDPFFTTRTEEGGTGLGLSIVHGTIAEHGGTINIDTESGKGTTVTIEFPILARSTDAGGP